MNPLWRPPDAWSTEVPVWDAGRPWAVVPEAETAESLAIRDPQ